VGWYRRWVNLPDNESWADKRVILTVGAADFFTDCWCNGSYLGKHEGGYLPFEFDITDALETLEDGSRRGLIVLRVEDPMENNEQPVGKQWRWYTTCSGIWQTVCIEPRAAAYLKCWRVVPDIDKGTAQLQVETVGAEGGASVWIQIQAPDGNGLQATIPAGQNICSITVTNGQLAINTQPICPVYKPISLSL